MMFSRLLFLGFALLLCGSVQAQFPCFPGQIALAPGFEATFCDDGSSASVIRFRSAPAALPRAYVVVNAADEIVYIDYSGTIDFAGLGDDLRVYAFSLIGSITAEVGDNLNDTELASGCYALSSNFITIDSNGGQEGGTLEGGPFTFCVGDGVPDMLEPGAITLTDNVSENSAWVVTDEQGNILGLPPSPDVVDFDGAGVGTCLVWHLSFVDGLIGAEVGLNANDLDGCYDLSNPIEVRRTQPDGGTLEGGPFTFCVGDGEADMLEPGSITLSGNSGTNSAWVVTDDQGNILGLPPMPSVVDFDGAGGGTCLIWHLSFEDGLQGAEVGMNAADLEGCYDLSNPIEVNRIQPDGGTLEGGPFSFCVGDGVADMIEPGSITLSGNTGANSAWVVTDDQGNILGLPPMPSAVDFDGAGAGTCLIWHLSFEDGLEGAEVGMNAADLQGCYDLSNPISVFRTQPDGGVLEGGPFTFCVGDDEPDMLEPGSITLSGNSGSNSAWVVTDEQGNILGLPPMPSAVDFDGAGAGTCLIWHLSFEEGLVGAEVGLNAADLIGCYDLSNPISVVRIQPEGGTLEGGPFSFCVGDGEADMIEPGSITLTGNSGTNSAWVVTDDQGNILGLPPMPSVVDFDGAGEGTCLIWHLSFEDGLEGAEVGLNAADLQGCYSLSNPISVFRGQPEGGTLEGGPFTFCVGDGEADMLEPGSITLSGNSGTNSAWVVTDDQGNILGLPPMPSVVDFDGAGAGTCLIWHLSFEEGLEGAEVGMNAADLQGCYDLSNPIEVNRIQPEGGNIYTDAEEVLNRVVIANRASGTISVIDSDNNTVIGTYDMPNDGEPMYVVYNSSNRTVLVGDYTGKVVAFDAVTFDVVGEATAGAGVFHMWISPDNSQLWVNNELDRTISVIDPSSLATIATVELPADLFAEGYKPHDVILMPNNAAAFVTLLGDGDDDYVIKYDATTFAETERLAVGLDPHVSLTSANDKLYVASQGADEVLVVNRSDLSVVTAVAIPNAHGLGMNADGTYLYVGNISDGGTDAHYTIDLATNMLVGDPVDAPFSAPHNYAVTSDNGQLFVTHSGAANNQVSVYELGPAPSLVTSLTVGNNPFGLAAFSVTTTTELSICAGDDISDAFDVTLEGASGTNSQWVITDADLNILALPAGPPFDLDGAGAGTCLIWHLSFEDGLVGAEVGMNAADLQGCFDLSNPITVVRYQPEGGTLEGGPFTFCVGDDVADMLEPGSITLTGNSGTNSAWVVTDDQGNILGLPPMPSAVDFDGAGAGTCLIWHLSFEDGLVGAEVGMNAADLQGCYDLSNPIEVNRIQPDGGTLEGGVFEFCVGDGEADMLAPGSITLSGNSGTNSAWVVTDEQGNILGLPPMPSAVDFDGAGVGVCLIWHLSFEDGLVGAEVGMNAADLQGCYDLSNPISVTRTENCDELCNVNGGALEGGPFTFCVGDDVADMLESGSITLNGNSGTNSAWVVTDEQGNILGLPPMPSAVDFDGAGAGTCLIWHLSFEDGLVGAEVGMNAADLEGCYDLSNPIAVVRNQPEGGTLEGGPFTFCVGDGEADMLEPGSITLSGNNGTNSAWVVTDDQGNILGLPPMPSAVDFDGAGAGPCLIWHLSFEDGLEGAEVGMNAADLQGCFSLSNPITVNRIQPEGGTLEGGPFTFCVSDGVADMLEPGSITLSGNSGTNSAWVVTDDQGNILGLPPMPSVVDFDGAGAGTCLVWHLSFEDGLEGAEVGMNAADLQGCYNLSNPIEVNRIEVNGGTVTTVDGESNITVTVGDGIDDVIEFASEGAVGENFTYIITDDSNNILAIPEGNSANFEGAEAGVCRVWGLSYSGDLIAETGQNAGEVALSSGCFNLSDVFLTVNRTNGFQPNVPVGDAAVETPAILQVQLYPNPAVDQLQVELNTKVYSQPVDVEVMIFQLDGKLRYRNIISSDQVRSTVDVSGLPAGTYLLRLNDGDQIVTKRFVKA